MTAAIERALGKLDEKYILDAGCGIGVLTQALVVLGAEVHGVDVSQTALSLAKERVPTPKFECVALDRLSHDAVFDAAVSMDVYFHIVDDGKWKQAICRLGRATKPIGVIIIQEMFDRQGATRPPHVHWRTIKQYQTVLADAGLEICDRNAYVLPNEQERKTILTIRHSPETPATTDRSCAN